MDTLKREIAYQRADLEEQLAAAKREIDETLERLREGRTVYANTLHRCSCAVLACQRLAVLESVARDLAAETLELE